MVNQSMLYYHNISRSNHGNHTCTATNIMVPTNGHQMTMSDSKVIFINVQYKTSISAFTAKDNNNLIMENGSLELSCQVDSNPYSDIFLYHEDKVQLEKEDTLKLNYTKTAGCLDAGKYTCRANNSVMHGGSVSSDLQIMVACYPRLDHRKNVSTVYYTGLNSSVTLEVFVIAYPEPTNITWYHRENETDMWQRVMYQPPSSGGLFSRMLIQIISTRDFGDYMVTMDNYLGNFSHTYRIIPEMVPVTFLGADTSTWFTVTGISAGIGVIVILAIVLIILKRRGYSINTLLKLCRKPSIKDPVYANSGTVCTPAEGDYEALQANRNGGSLYQELSDIKNCADAKYNFRSATDTTEKHQTYVTGKETSDTSLDQRNLLKGENKIYENTRVQK